MDYLHTLDDIRSNIRQVIVGKDTVIDHLLISLVCSGHVLIEDMPGPGQNHAGLGPGVVSGLHL